MGIKGLPAVLEPYLRPTHVEEHRGARAAVDAYSWLHKGAFSCAMNLAPGGDRWWTRARQEAPYVKYCVHRARLLRFNGIEPVIVFDGDRLPAKREEEAQRRERRREAMKRGTDARELGDERAALNAFAGGVDVTPEMAKELMEALKREKFEYVCAPYEADAQIASLAKTPRERGGVDLVFTEDTDLVAYGCPRVMFKLEKSGDVKELNLETLFAGPPEKTLAPTDENVTEDAVVGVGKKKTGPPPLNFAEWDYELFLSLCVLSGCDFLDNIRGLGIKKMYNILNKHRDVDAAFKALRSDAKTKDNIPDGYEEKWRQARLIFKHALVYDAFDKALRHLTPLGEDVASKYDDLSFLGPVFDDVEAKRIAEGELNPISRQKFIQSPPAAGKKSTDGGKLRFGAKRKQGRAPADAGTNAQRSLMMNFFTKLVPTSPLRKKPAPEPAAPSLDDEDDDDILLAVEATTTTTTTDAAVPRETDTIDLACDTTPPRTMSAFARASPPKKTNFLTNLFSPSRKSR
jgi:exonuclease-1